MTINKFGGNKQKSQARKSVQNKNASTRLRQTTNESEKYAIVKKLFGNGRCLVHTIDNVEKNCIIRGKFRGKKKRDNILIVGSWVLVDIRDWQSENSNDCDLLEVYSSGETDKLKELNYDWSILTNSVYDGKKDASLETSDVYFTDNNEPECETIIIESKEKGEKYDYNIDDI
jgi:initiation factor 1A